MVGMDQEDEKQQEDIENADGAAPHVRIFGAEVGPASADTHADGGTTSADGPHKRHAQWKAERQARRAEWKARKQEMRQWRHEHHDGGRIFWGLIVLFVGIFALFYTIGLVPAGFWQTIWPFWPVLLILRGASIMLGGHWFARFIIFLLALAFFVAVAIYGLVRVDSPMSSDLPPNIVSQINNLHPPQPY